MRIGIDVDNIVCNTAMAVLEQHYADTGERLTLDDITSYYIENHVSEDFRDDFHLIFLNKEMWKRVKVLSNCVDVIRRLYEQGNEIFFVTSTESANVAKKHRFLQRTFPFLNIRKRLITTHYKQMIDLDVLIDDCIDNIIFAPYYSIILDYPWNHNFDDAADDKTYRVFDWTQVEPMIEYIKKVKCIKENKNAT